MDPKDVAELLDAVESLTYQGCTRAADGTLYSGCLWAFADGLRLLEKHGRVRIVRGDGRNIWAQPVPPEPTR